MTSAQVVEISVNVNNNNSSIQIYTKPDDHTRRTTENYWVQLLQTIACYMRTSLNIFTIKKELSASNGLLAKYKWAVIRRHTFRDFAFDVIPLPSEIPVFLGSKHVATILLISLVVWFPASPVLVGTFYRTAVNPVKLRVRSISLEADPRTTPCDCLLLQ